MIRPALNRRVPELALKWGLFILWPVIACLLMFCVALVCALAWIVIPLGKAHWEDNSWSLKFPWSKP